MHNLFLKAENNTEMIKIEAEGYSELELEK